jgi:hypothetical protein
LLNITFEMGLHNLGSLEMDSPNLYGQFDTTMSPISLPVTTPLGVSRIIQ